RFQLGASNMLTSSGTGHRPGATMPLALRAEDLPSWVGRDADLDVPWTRVPGGIDLRIVRGRSFDVISVSASRASDLDEGSWRSLSHRVYERLRDACAGRRPIRIWNHVPAITASLRPGFDRYMAFNEGRHAVMSSWFGEALEGILPTATGVGHDEPMLAVHALVGDVPCRSIENPRQRPAVRYSRRYGPRPPCFARAGMLDVAGRRTLLVSGTASVRGEDTVHEDDFEGQVDETLANLRALVVACDGRGDTLEAFDSLRVYCTARIGDPELDHLRSVLPPCETEFVRADLCRPELMVEIEGVASWSLG
ncbi:MAG: hypothetical protein KDA28_10530, partial [Phycisphaerales bacterium]|nr:hypothetical protein [Phycisphaerales bacterium]